MTADPPSAPVGRARLATRAATFVVLIVLLGAGIMGDRWYERLMVGELRETVRGELDLIDANLEHALARRLAVLDALEEHVRERLSAEGTLDARRFRSLARAADRMVPGLQGLALAPEGNQTLVYPPGSERWPDLTEDSIPPGRPDARSALGPSRTVIAGPRVTRDGLGLVMRRGLEVGGEPWGLVTVVVALPEILDEAGLDVARPELDFALRGPTDELVAGDPDIFGRSPETTPVALAGPDWVLAAVPTRGWGGRVRERHEAVHLFGLAIIGLVTLAFHLGLARFLSLSEAVARRTADLDRLNRDLRDQASQLELLFDRAGDAMYLTDLEGQLVRVNDKACEMTGYSREELLSMNVLQVDAMTHSREQLAEVVRTLLPGEPVVMETVHRSRDGGLRPVELTFRVFEVPQGPRMLGIARDISERKAAERSLRQSEALYRQLFDASPIGIFLSEPFTLSNPNRRALEMFGHEREVFDPASPDLFSPEFQPDGSRSSEKARRYVEAAMAGVPQAFEWRHQRVDGSTFDAEVRLVRIDVGGEPKILATVADISDRKRAEAEQEKLRAQLIQAQKMEAVGRLAGGVAHDFNNMLTVIRGNVQLALLDSTSAELRESLSEIDRASQRSADLTRQLLAFAREANVSPRVLDLDETIEGTLRMLRRLIGEDITLQWTPSSELPPIEIDPSQVDQILANLCVNARDAIDGVGNISIETRAESDPTGGGTWVRLEVRDDGCGMDEETRERVFEPFFTTKREGKGTGLGLSTVYGIVEQNGGRIRVDSAPGRGTTVRIDLPAVEREGSARRGDPSGPVELPAGGETVLVVEDEPAILRLARTMLESLGYRVFCASNAPEALALAEAEEIDVVITDVVMPDMSGLALADELWRSRPRLPVLFMSGYTDRPIPKPEASEPRAVSFIHKPFSRSDLAHEVRQLLTAPVNA